MSKEIINTPNAPAAIGPYVQAIKAGNMLFASGQIPIDPATGEIVEGGIEAQAHQSMKNAVAVLEAAGYTTADVVKTTVFITDLADFGVVNEIYGSYFGGSFPARSCVQVAALPKGAKIEVETISVK